MVTRENLVRMTSTYFSAHYTDDCSGLHTLHNMGGSLRILLNQASKRLSRDYRKGRIFDSQGNNSMFSHAHATPTTRVRR